MERGSLTGSVCAVVVPLFLVSCAEDGGPLPPMIATAELPASRTADAPGTDAADTRASDVGSPPAVGAPVPVRVSLIDHFEWLPLDAEEDPFDDRRAESSCALDGVTVASLGGELSYDIETGTCNYITATQPSQQPVAVDDLVKVRLWHFELTAPEPGEGHAVLEIDGKRVLDARVPIPGPGGLVKAEVRIDRPVPAGAPIHFHLHNHGQNSWALVEVSTGH